MKFIISIFLFLFVANNQVSAGVNDSIPYELFKNKFIVYFDRGINAAPFDLTNIYNYEKRTLKFKNNVQPTLGFGIGFRGIGVRVGLALPVYLQPSETSGTTNYYDLGLKINRKQFYIEAHVRRYKGYYIENADEWSDTLLTSHPNDIRPNTQTFGISMNMYYFQSKKFNYQAVNGILGHYQGRAGTMYLKATSNVFNLQDPSGIIPLELHDTTDLNSSVEIGAFDFGLVPGFAFATRKKSWQFAFLAGLGGVIQNKYFKYPDTTTVTTNKKNEFFLAPRMDLKVITGISKPKFFVLLSMDFDIKSLRILQDLTYAQTFYNFQIATGLRFNTKKKTKQTD